MSNIVIQFSDLQTNMIVRFFIPGNILVSAFVNRGEGKNGITYYLMPCKRTEIESITIINPNGEKQKKNINQFESDLRVIHGNSVAFVYR